MAVTLWPSQTPHSTANFDQDTDNVAGTGNARDDLKELIEKLNAILSAVEPSATIYSDQTKGEIAFKDVSNVFTIWQWLKDTFFQDMDVAAADQVYHYFRNTAADTLWTIRILSDVNNNSFRIMNDSNNTYIQLDTNMQNLVCGAAGITYGNQAVQMQPVKVTKQVNYTLGLTGTFDHSAQSTSVPDMIVTKARCLSADLGYTPGMIIDINNSIINQSDSGGNDFGDGYGIFYYDYDGATSGVLIGSWGIQVLRRDDRRVGVLTVGSWIIEMTLYWW